MLLLINYAFVLLILNHQLINVFEILMLFVYLEFLKYCDMNCDRSCDMGCDIGCDIVVIRVVI